MRIEQLNLFETKRTGLNEQIRLTSYDHFIVAFSGGKDSTAALLDLLERGVPKDKIELWHHIIDGREGSTLMDWPVTEDYVREFGKAFGIKTFFSWKEGGFEGEMLRKNAPTAPNKFEVEDEGDVECGIEVLQSGGRGPNNTRRKFPQVSADLSVRWCSAYLKIDVGAAAIRNQDKFNNKRTLVITGERAEESTARAKYKTFEPDRADLRSGKIKRHVDHYRNVHHWQEERVWEIIKRHGIVVHPAYYLGWGRLSCMKCIFGSDNQWASINFIDKPGFDIIAFYEEEFGITIHRTLGVKDRAKKGSVYPQCLDRRMVEYSQDNKYRGKIFTDNWVLPAGAFGESNGPT